MVGTVGMPGERTFYVQIVNKDARLSIRVEKAQVATLAEQIQRIVATLNESGVHSGMAPEPDDRPLESPIDEDFVASAIGLGWDDSDERVIVELHELSDLEPADFGDDDDDAADTVRVRLSLAEASAFADRALAVVNAGRPICPFCQLPLDPSGHICPRANGYRRQV